VSTRWARALVLEQPRTLVPRELAVPEVGDDDALLRVEACGLCGTDHEQYTGHLPAGFAFVPGHETVGVIEAIGDKAARRWGLASGDRVAVEVFQSCRVCDACRAGAYQRCERHGLGDMYGYIPVDRPPGLWGGYAQRQYLGPDAIVHRVPDVLDPVVATLFNPLGAGVRWAVTVPGTGAGDVVAVLGPGVRGLSAAAAAKEAGAAFVMVTGRGRRDAGRLAVAGDFGADLAVDVAENDPVRAPGRRARWSWPERAAARCPSSRPTSSCSRSCASSGPSASTPPPTTPRSSSSPATGTRSPTCRAASSGSTTPRP
jgi:alcohol dehydrogenase